MTRKANFPVACLFLFGFMILPAADASAALEPDEAGAHYREAFELLDVDLSDQETDALYGEEEGEMSEPTRNRIREGLEVLSRAASAETVDWGLEAGPNEFFASSIWKVLVPARTATQMAAWYVREFGAEKPDEAIGILEDLLILSGHINEGGMAVQMVSSIAMEGFVYLAVADVAGQWETRDRERLLSIIQSEAPTRSA